MKRLAVFLLLAGPLISCAEENRRVLLFVPEESRHLELMLTTEIDVMKEMLMQSGFEVVIATVSGEIRSEGKASLVPDMKVADVKIDDFAGLVMADMGLYLDQADQFSPDVVSMVEEAVAKRKVIAAQWSSVVALAKAGALSERKYAFSREVDASRFPYFEGAIYSGRSVVRDGRIITSGSNPFMKKVWGFPDTTIELIATFVEVMGGPR